MENPQKENPRIQMIAKTFSQSALIRRGITGDRNMTDCNDLKTLLDAYDEFMRGGENSELVRTVVNAAVFAAAAYEKHGRGDVGTHAIARTFLLAAMDPTHHELDYLRADPASGEVARSATKKLRAIFGGDA